MLTYQKERQLYQKILEAQESLASGYFPTLFELTRWLEATEGDVDEAFNRLLNTLAWRQANSVDELLSTNDWKPALELRQNNPAKLIGLDYQSGAPIWLLSLGKIDIKGLIRKFSAESFIKEALLTLETSVAFMRGLTEVGGEKAEAAVRQHIIVVDLRGLKIAQVLDAAVIRLVGQLTHLHEAHYPETLREAVIIAPSLSSTICHMAISLVKPFLAPRTRDKLRVTTYCDFFTEPGREALNKMTANPEENDNDNKTKNRRPSELSTSGTVDLEGSVPYLGKPHLLDEIMCRQNVGPRCKLGLKFRVTKTNMELRWRFRTLKGKMTFAIYRQKIVAKSNKQQQTGNAEHQNETESLKDLRNLMAEATVVNSTATDEGQETGDFYMVDMNSKIDVVKQSMTVNSSKDYVSGKHSVDPFYDYLVILGNPSTLFPSTTVLHLVELVSQDAVSPVYEMFLKAPKAAFINDVMEPPKTSEKYQDEDREAKIEDLLNFVTEIAKSDNLVGDVKKKVVGPTSGTITKTNK